MVKEFDSSSILYSEDSSRLYSEDPLDVDVSSPGLYSSSESLSELSRSLSWCTIRSFKLPSLFSEELMLSHSVHYNNIKNLVNVNC